MIDPKLLRHATADVAGNLARRGFDFDADAYLALEERRKALQVATEELRSEWNTSSKAIGKAKAQGEDIEPLLAAVQHLGDKLAASEAELQSVLADLQAIELGLPNLLQDDVPDGTSGFTLRTLLVRRLYFLLHKSYACFYGLFSLFGFVS